MKSSVLRAEDVAAPGDGRTPANSLLAPPPEPPRRRIGFHADNK